MSLALFAHPACALHDPGPHHPESPARIRRLEAVLAGPEFTGLARHEAPRATEAQLALVHDARYVAEILALAPGPDERIALDADTFVGPGSVEAALRAAGGAVAAVDLVMGGAAPRAFVAARPPGHHAERARAMGFCLFASAAVAARHAQAVHGAGRVAILDFDVHHGNGTQEAAWGRADLFYASSHQMPCFPGTGPADDTGAHGNVVNVPLPPGTGAGGFRAAWRDRILPAVRDFAPDLLVVSAGFDAHRDDPLAQLELDAGDFAWLTEELVAVADAACGGRLVSILEGGYDLEALTTSCALHVKGLWRN